MTKAKKFKNRVRARAEKTGESYQAARRHFGRFEGVVRATIDLAEHRDTSPRRWPPQVLSASDLAVLAQAPESPVRRALRSHLQTLTDSDLFKLQSLMYAGRDQGDPVSTHMDIMSRTRDRLDAQETLLSKVPLAEFLKRGLEVAKQRGTDLDRAWEPRTPAMSEDMGRKVKPFDVHMNRGGDPTSVRMSGQIVGDVFIVSILGEEVEIPALLVGRDERGTYVLLDEAQYPLRDSFVLKVEPEPDEDFPTGTTIKVVLPGRSKALAESALREAGLEPEAVHLLDPPEAVFAVHFNAWGLCDGQSTAGRIWDGYPPLVLN